MALKIFFLSLIISLYFINGGLAWAQNKPLSQETLRQLYHQAYCAFETEDFQTAKKIFTSLKGKYPQLGDYIYHYLAKSQFALSDYANALKNWQTLVTLYPKSRLITEAKLGQAQAYIRQEFYLHAAELYQQIIEKGLEDKENIGEAYLNFGMAMEILNKPDQAAILYQYLWFNYPTVSAIPIIEERIEFLKNKYQWPLPIKNENYLWKHIKALKKEKKYQEALSVVEEFLKKFPKSNLLPKVYLAQSNCYFQMSQRKNALPGLKKIIINYPKSPQVTTALYYLAKAYWNLGDDRGAIRNLTYLIKNYPHTSWADDALFILGRVHEGNGAYKRAFKTYKRLIVSYPYSVWATRGIWRTGWLHFRLENYLKAINTFKQINKKTNHSPWTEACLYWKGRAFENLGKIKNAVKTYQKLISIANYTYYAQLAQKRLPRISKNYKKTNPKPIIPLAWKTPAISKNSPELAFHFERVKELSALSIPEDLKNELDIMAASSTKDLDFWVYLSYSYQIAEDYKQAIQIMWRYLELKKFGVQQLPSEARLLLYPRFFWEELKECATQHNIDPYLLTALIRRESIFDFKATSWAGAMGLMQIIPNTANKIAKQLNDHDFYEEDLYNPKVNLRYGSFYLSQLLKRFHSRLHLALAAYNAGENHTKRWEQANEQEGWEEFVENIPFSETRRYVRQVISNYNNYLLLYTETQHVPDNPH